MIFRALVRRFKIPNNFDSKRLFNSQNVIYRNRLLTRNGFVYCAIGGLTTYAFIKWHQYNTVHAINLKKTKVSKLIA